MTNLEFLRKHARIGRIGLVGGCMTIEKGIRLAQRHLDPDGKPSLWSHVFIFEGERVDGHQWLLESDVDVRLGRMMRVGVQENRIDKYASEKEYPNVAVLDLGVSEADGRRMVAAGLDLASSATRYAIGGLFKTYIAILRKQTGADKKKDSTFCSSFVRTLFQHVGIDFAPGVAVRHTAPEHCARAKVTGRWEMIRSPEL